MEVVGAATESETGLQLCAELRPDAVFLDIKLPGKDGVSLATQLAMLPQPPRLVFPNRCGSTGRGVEDATLKNAASFSESPVQAFLGLPIPTKRFVRSSPIDESLELSVL